MNNSDDKNKINNDSKSKSVFPISLNLKGIGLEKTLVALSILLLVIIAIAAIFHSVIVPITKNNAKINDQLYNAYAHVDDFKKNVYGEDQTPNMENNVFQDKNIVGISCWGDSFNIAANQQTPSFGAYIAAACQTYVFNVASNKDNIEMVAGRQGGVPMMISPCDIPAKKQSVEITLTNEYGTELTPDFSKNGGLNPVTINGVEGVISSIDDKYYFTRSQSGYETFIYQPTPVQTRAMGVRNNDISIFFIGSVDKLETKERMVEIYQKMAKALGTDQYLVVGPVSGDTAKVNEYNQALAAAFGNKYFDLHSYLCGDQILKDNKFKLNEENKKMAAAGQIPKAFLLDNKHFNQTANEAIGKRLSQKLLELKYVDKIL
ncbi:MAG: hypothetical protein KH038_06880 [Eubacterium sp.]|nr:hypothetical protein [Eubacterium sp.]